MISILIAYLYYILKFKLSITKIIYVYFFCFSLNLYCMYYMFALDICFSVYIVFRDISFPDNILLIYY